MLLFVLYNLIQPVGWGAGLVRVARRQWFLAAYIGLTIPTVIVGVLNQSLSARSATLIVASAVALVARLASALQGRNRAQRTKLQTTTTQT